MSHLIQIYLQFIQQSNISHTLNVGALEGVGCAHLDHYKQTK